MASWFAKRRKTFPLSAAPGRRAEPLRLDLSRGFDPITHHFHCQIILVHICLPNYRGPGLWHFGWLFRAPRRGRRQVATRPAAMCAPQRLPSSEVRDPHECDPPRRPRNPTPNRASAACSTRSRSALRKLAAASGPPASSRLCANLEPDAMRLREAELADHRFQNPRHRSPKSLPPLT